MVTPPASSKGFHCSQCGKAFGRIEHLRRHELTHSGQRPFQCRICSKGFVRRDALRRHEATHRSGETLIQRGARACTNCAAAKSRCTGEPCCHRCRERNLSSCDFPLSLQNDRATTTQQTASPDCETPYVAAQHGPDFGAPPTVDFWDPGILSTTNWLDALGDFPFDDFETLPAEATFEPHPIQSGQHPVINPSIDASESGLSAFSSAASKPAISATDDPADTAAGEYYVDGEPARLPRVKRRRTRTVTSASETNALNGFTLEWPADKEIEALDREEISEEAYQAIVAAYRNLCLVENALWPAFQQHDFPEKVQMQQLLGFYWTCFHPSLPFLPRTHNPGPYHIKILAMCAIGSMYAEMPSSFCLSMLELLRRTLVRDQEVAPSSCDDLDMAAAKLLQYIGLMYCGDPRLKRHAVQDQQVLTDVFSTARRYHETCCDASRSHVDVTSVHWLQSEHAIRLAYSAWLVDAIAASQYHCRPLLGIADATLPLPCNESLWEEDVQVLQTLSSSRPRPVTLQIAVQELFIDKRLPRDRGEFARILIIHGIYHRLWEVERYYSSPLSAWEPTAKRQMSGDIISEDRVWLPAIPAFAKWQNSACDALDILHWQANATIGQASGLEHPTVFHLHFARLVLLAPCDRIVRLAQSMMDSRMEGVAGDEDTRLVRQWAMQHQYKARLAAIHAGVLFWHVRRYSIDAFYESPAIGLAALALWAFGTFSGKRGSSSQSRARSQERQPIPKDGEGQGLNGLTDDEPICNIILLDRPTDDELVQSFIRQGHMMQAHITGVGDLYSARGPPRVLQQACKLLSSLGCWGVSSSWRDLLQKLVAVVSNGAPRPSQLET